MSYMYAVYLNITVTDNLIEMLLLVAIGIALANAQLGIAAPDISKDNAEEVEARFFDIKKKLCELGLTEVSISS